MNQAHKPKQSRRIAFGGIVTALSLTSMLLSGLFPFLEYTCPALAGILLVALVLEFNKRTSFIAYGAVSILSLILCPNKEAAVLFVFFMGYYPIVKSFLEQLRSRIVEWILKISIFNLSILAGYWVIVNLFGLTEILEGIQIGGITFSLQISLLILLLAGNAAFIVYDLALSRLVVLYCQVLRPKLRKIFP